MYRKKQIQLQKCKSSVSIEDNPSNFQRKKNVPEEADPISKMSNFQLLNNVQNKVDQQSTCLNKSQTFET
jgi:hypothetical protein